MCEQLENNPVSGSIPGFSSLLTISMNNNIINPNKNILNLKTF